MITPHPYYLCLLCDLVSPYGLVVWPPGPSGTPPIGEVHSPSIEYTQRLSRKSVCKR